MRHLALASFAAALLALPACVHVHEHDHHHEQVQKGGGPPPGAPAHGYRRHHQDSELRFDARLGVYVVVGYPHVYFDDGHYFRYVSTHWERCGNLKKAHWKSVDVDRVPGRLAQHYAKKGGKYGAAKGKGKGHGPAKHDD